MFATRNPATPQQAVVSADTAPPLPTFPPGTSATYVLTPVPSGRHTLTYGSLAPAVFFWVGSANEALGTTFPHHHPRFDIDEAALRAGIAVFARTALDALA